MKKIKPVSLLTLILITFPLACSHSRISSRKPNSAPSIPIEIDPKFEHPWNGDIAAEQESLEELGTTIGGFVAKEAVQNQTWKTELDELRSKDPDSMSEKQKKRYRALSVIFDDLPLDAGFATRDVHRRPQACLNASLQIRDDIPTEDQKGLFQPSARYDAVVRFSNGNPRNLPDFAPDARGMAVKLLPEGALSKIKSPSEFQKNGLLDILAINFPVFFVNDPEKYVGVNEAFLAVSDNPEAALDPSNFYFKFHEFLSVFTKGMSPWERELALQINGSVIANPLYEQYWSMMSYRLGDSKDDQRTAIKYKWVPCAENLPEGGVPAWSKNHNYAEPRLPLLQHDPFDDIPKDLRTELSKPQSRYYLRKNLLTSLSKGEKCFDLQIQRFVDEESTPVEDTTQIWLENASQQKIWADKFAENGGPRFQKEDRRKSMIHRKISPPVTIAKLILKPYPASEVKKVLQGQSSNTAHCEDMSFDPWNNVPSAHRPLGIVGRMRRYAYSASKHTRHQINGVSEN